MESGSLYVKQDDYYVLVASLRFQGELQVNYIIFSPSAGFLRSVNSVVISLYYQTYLTGDLSIKTFTAIPV